MIIISQPKLEVRENEVLVSSCIEDDKKHFRETIFYKTSAAYGPYAVTEKADLRRTQGTHIISRSKNDESLPGVHRTPYR